MSIDRTLVGKVLALICMGALLIPSMVAAKTTKRGARVQKREAKVVRTAAVERPGRVAGPSTSKRKATAERPRVAKTQTVAKTKMVSKTAATKVALERLGYKVPAAGDGAQVVQVAPKGPADGVLQVGDVITAVDGAPVKFDDESVTAVHHHKPGDVITFTINRGGQSETVPVHAGDDGHGVARIGVALQTKNLRYDFPVQVAIDTGKVAGPSAGLAFTLALLDDLDPGDLTGGKRVAVTGTIDINGAVGGPIRQNRLWYFASARTWRRVG